MKAPGSKDWYKRGTKGDVKTKFLKGACENCGATTHTKKDCVERPRKLSAKKTGKNLMPDEYVETLDLDYEGKRDRWNGYQADDYKEVIEDWEKVEAERRMQKAREQEERAKMREKFKTQKKALKKKRKQRRRQLRRMAEGRDADGTDTDGTDSDANDSDTDTDTDSDSDASDDEDFGEKMKDFDKNTNSVATKDDKLRTTTRNLRIREDTAKYLLNLDVNSAFYDPKSRSMRQNPLAHLADADQGTFRGDNYVRGAGDTKKLAELTCFAWDAYKHGEKIHDFAQPTQAAKMYDIFQNRSKNLKETQQKELMDKYGGEEHLEAPREILFSQNDNYVEYSRDGRVLKGRERAYEKSKYEEDVMVGNHTSTWGSWFDVPSGRFGFKCCKQLMKNSYCIPQSRQDAMMDVPGADDSVAAASSSAAAEGVLEVAGQVPSSSDSDSSKSSGSGSDSDKDGAGEDAPVDDAQKAALEEAKKAAAEEKRKARALKGLKLASKEAAKAAAAQAQAAAAAPVEDPVDSASKLADKRAQSFGHNLEEATEFNDAKVKEARKAEKKRAKTVAQGLSLEDERNRKYGGLAADQGDLSPEEYEAYRMERTRGDDPMAQFK